MINAAEANKNKPKKIKIPVPQLNFISQFFFKQRLLKVHEKNV
jgi:hypothetical protein